MKTEKKLLTGTLLALCTALLVLCSVLAIGWSKAAKTGDALPEVRNNGTAIQWKYGDMPVYITFDIDALDPSAAPGTGTPVIGGPTSAQARQLLYELRGINVVAADLVEVLPAYDHSEITALAAATIAQDLMYLMYNKE